MTYYIPNTNVEAKVLDPNPMNSFVSLYLNNGDTNNGKYVGSVNAGTSNAGQVFVVGLGGINGAFKSVLKKTQDTDAYETIHMNMYKASGSNRSEFSSKFTVNDPVQFSFMLKPDPKFSLPQYDGIVFIDVFNPKQFPNGNAQNYSMLYLVPPNRAYYPDEKGFLDAVEATCITLVEALNEYNSKHAAPGNSLKLKPIEDIRMCLFSGGIYRGGTPQDDVAAHNLLGLEAGFKTVGSTQNQVSQVEFENSFDNSTLQNVFESLKSKLSTGS
jgi:hypothetical protein